MTDISPESFELLVPGDIIELKDQTELIPFEDVVALSIDRQMPEILPDITTRLNLVAWAGRQTITELIRPQKPRPFIGTIANIQLEVMADADERLADAQDRGWQVGRAATLPSVGLNVALLPLYRGFKFFAEARSSGRGTIGEIQSEIWYYPKHLKVNYKSGGTGGQAIDSSAGSSVCRIVARPKMEVENFAKLDETSRRIGLALLKNNLRFPLRTPMQD